MLRPDVRRHRLPRNWPLSIMPIVDHVAELNAVQRLSLNIRPYRDVGGTHPASASIT